LVERQRSGIGRRITLAQMETAFAQLATEYVRESLQPGTLVARGNTGEFDAPCGLFPCQGEDAYCAVTVDGDDDWANLARIIGHPELATDTRYATAADRVAHRAELDSVLQEWISPLTPREAQELLQAGGVAAGAAVHVKDLLTDPHLAARQQLCELIQPGHDAPLDVLQGPALFEVIPSPLIGPAPEMAADTRDICRDVIGLSDAEIHELTTAGDIEPPAMA
jgi:crotonobetainyl-CoA:carnitine CoA-transferase CaiB-like acyl-CoA transferase